jgi:hypothetical protein
LLLPIYESTNPLIKKSPEKMNNRTTVIIKTIVSWVMKNLIVSHDDSNIHARNEIVFRRIFFCLTEIPSVARIKTSARTNIRMKEALTVPFAGASATGEKKLDFRVLILPENVCSIFLVFS